MKKLKIAYFGSPDFSARFLEKLLADPEIKKLVDVKLVVTQPDRPVGRKQILTPSPVKLTAKKLGIAISESVNQTNRFTDNLFPINRSTDLLKNIDLALLFAYGQIIPRQLLNLPKYGFFNIHPSLLPQYRGPSPISYPLILGDKQTGVTIIKMDEKIDHGPIIAQEKLTISQTDKRPDLEVKLTNLAFKMFKKIIATKLDLHQQNHQKATFTRLLTKNDGYIPLTTLIKSLNNERLTFKELPIIIKEYLSKYQHLNKYPLLIENGAKIIYGYFRGLYPWPGVWTLIRQGGGGQAKRLKIIDMKLKDGKLEIKKVQLEGKKPIDFQTFNRAYKIFHS